MLLNAILHIFVISLLLTGVVVVGITMATEDLPDIAKQIRGEGNEDND